MGDDKVGGAGGMNIDGALVRALEKSLGLATPVGNTA